MLSQWQRNAWLFFVRRLLCVAYANPYFTLGFLLHVTRSAKPFLRTALQVA